MGKVTFLLYPKILCLAERILDPHAIFVVKQVIIRLSAVNVGVLGVLGGWVAKAKGFGTYRNYDWMYERYIDRSMSMTDIAKEIDCSVSSVSGWLTRLGIKKRSFSETAKLLWNEERREIYRTLTKEVASRPEVRKKLLVSMASARRNAHTEEAKEKRSRGLVAAHARGAYDNETVEKQRRARKAAWQRGTYEGMHQTPEYREMMVLAHDNPETRRKTSEGVRVAHQRPEVKQKHRKAIQASWTAERRMEQSVISSEIHNRLDVKRRRAETLKITLSDPKVRRRMSEAVKLAWAVGKYDNVDRFPNGQSSIECETAQVLTELGFEFISEWSPKGYRRRYDFYLPGFGVTIECQGDYYHDEAAFPGVTKHDEEKRIWATEHGLIPLEFWESDIHEYGAKMLLVEELVGEGLV